MKKLSLRVRKWFRNVLMGSSLTAVAFVFQACYGVSKDFGLDFKLTGTVQSKTTKKPIKGIKVMLKNAVNYGITDENGKFDFYVSMNMRIEKEDSLSTYPRYEYLRSDSIAVQFLDTDSIENGGWFQDKEIIVNARGGQDEIRIFMELEEKANE